MTCEQLFRELIHCHAADTAPKVAIWPDKGGWEKGLGS